MIFRVTFSLKKLQCGTKDVWTKRLVSLTPHRHEVCVYILFRQRQCKVCLLSLTCQTYKSQRECVIFQRTKNVLSNPCKHRVLALN